MTCDTLTPTFYRSKMVTARKRHECCECGGTIEPGESYQRVAMLVDGDFLSLATCSPCVEVFAWADKEGFCPEHEGLYEILGNSDLDIDYGLVRGCDAALKTLTESGLGEAAAKHLLSRVEYLVQEPEPEEEGERDE